jgi:hypothetical protein
MTNTNGDATDALPTLITVSQAFTRRLPSQRVVDQLNGLEPAGFKAIAENQAFRLIAFQALVRAYPGRDMASLWLHAYDVDVDISDADPMSGSSRTAGPPSAVTTVSVPTTSTG